MKHLNTAPKANPILGVFQWVQTTHSLRRTGKSTTFFVASFLLIALVAFAVEFRESIFVSTPESRPGAEDGSAPWVGWIILALVCLITALYAAVSKHLRVDRVEIDSSGVNLTYSFVPKPLGDYVTVRKLFQWHLVGRIEGLGPDIADGSGAYVRISLLEPLKTGDGSILLPMGSEEDMQEANVKIVAW